MSHGTQCSLKKPADASEDQAVTGRVCLLFSCLAAFNLIVPQSAAILGSYAAFAMGAVTYAQVGLVATWGVFSSAHFARRLAISGGVGLVLFSCLALGTVGPFGPTREGGRIFAALVLICPIFLFAVQAPLWAARIWFGYEIAKADEPPRGSYRRPSGIIDLIIVTAAVGVALTAARIGPRMLTTPVESHMVTVYFVGAAGIAGAASLVTVTPLVFITLAPRRLTSVFTGLAIWQVLLSPTLLLLYFATSNTDAGLWYACLWGPTLFAAVSCTGLLIVRGGEYRLLRRGRG